MFRLIVHERVRAELQSLPAVVQAKMIHLLDKLRQDPLVLREPYSKPLRDGLFEV
jgi:mRNA-degrading endonuclease RelE of RelBE toxin-antitoxin system